MPLVDVVPQGIFDVRNYGAAGDGVTDDTAAIQAALDAANAAAGGTVYGPGGGTTYLISGTLVTYPSVRILLDPDATIRLADGSDCTMLIDSAHHAGTLTVPSPVTGITVEGGTWDRGNNIGTDLERHALILGGSGLVVRDVTFQSTGAVGGAKYALLIQNAVDFTVERVRGLAYISDLIHVVGPAQYGVIRQIYATANKDDVVALTPIDWTGNLFGNESDVADILIDGVFADSQQIAHAVAIFSGKSGATVLNTRRIKVRNVHGSINAGALSAIYIADTSVAPAQGGAIDDVLIDGVDCSVQASQPLVDINSMGAASSIGVGSVTLRNVTVRADMAAIVSNWAPLASLVLDGVTGATASGPFGDAAIYQNGALASISRLRISSADLTSAGAQGGSLISAATAGQALGEVFLSGVRISNFAYLATLITTTSLRLGNVRAAGNAGIIDALAGSDVTMAITAACEFDATASAGTGTLAPFGNLQPVADTGTAGFALQNSTPHILSWTAPADGRLHMVTCAAYGYVSAAETGGEVRLHATTPEGPAIIVVVFGGNSGTGILGPGRLPADSSSRARTDRLAAARLGAHGWRRDDLRPALVGVGRT